MWGVDSIFIMQLRVDSALLLNNQSQVTLP